MGCRSKADQFFRETCRIPVAGLVLATLLLGDSRHRGCRHGRHGLRTGSRAFFGPQAHRSPVITVEV